MKNILCIILFHLFTLTLYSQEKVNIAVIELDGSGIPKTDLISFSNRLRFEFFNTNIYNVIERSKMEEILKEQGFQQTGCTNTECAVEIGKLLNVSYVVLGNVDKVGNIYSFNVRLVNVMTGKIKKNQIEDCFDCTIDYVFINTIKNVTRKICDLPVENNSTVLKNIQKLSKNKKNDDLKKPYIGSLCSVIPGLGHIYASEPLWALFYFSLRVTAGYLPFTNDDNYHSQQRVAQSIGAVLAIVDMVHAYKSVESFNNLNEHNISTNLFIPKKNIYITYSFKF